MEHFCEHPSSIIRGPLQGCFAEYVLIKSKQVYKIPETMSLKKAALLEPTSIAVHAIDKAEVRTGEVVVIIGGGPIGLLIANMARIAGAATIIISEPSSVRRDYANKFGFNVVVDPTKEDLLQTVLKYSNGKGADVCIEAVGIPSLIEICPSLVRYGGRVLLVGWPPRESSVKINPFLIYRYEIQIRGSQLAPYSFGRALRMLNSLDIDSIITHEFSLSEAAKAFYTQKQRVGLKILIKP